MRAGMTAMGAAALVLAASATWAAERGPVPAVQAAPAAGDASAIIAGRQAAFRMSGALFGSLKAAASAPGADVTKLGFASRAIAGWAKALPGMFPAGSNGAPSGAAPTVWSDRAGFEAKAAAYAAAADKLADLAKAGDTAGFIAQLDVVNGACGACHSGYRISH